jgi:ribosomal protein S12 methylthiotransferase accessory factor
VILATSLRSARAAQTWGAAQGPMRALGITRVTDITRLDRLGVPVYASIRPRGRILRVHAGKGLHADEARVGAAMEAIEHALAERDSLLPPTATLRWRDLARRWPAGWALDEFAPVLGATLRADDRTDVIDCEWLGHAERVPLPAELVRLPHPRRAAPGVFPWSTNGLASGNTLDEATLHALLELLERDATAMNMPEDRSLFVDPAELPAPWAAWCRHWREAEGVHTHVRVLPNDFGLPCFAATLHEPASLDVNLARGHGLHLSRDIALARALSEAAQSRLSTIHGGRDDITHFYGKYAQGDVAVRVQAEAAVVQRLQDRSRRIAYADVPQLPVPGVAQALAAVRQRLAERGFPDLLRHRLDVRGVADGLHVVKLVLRGAEALEHDNRRLGRRLAQRVHDTRQVRP